MDYLKKSLYEAQKSGNVLKVSVLRYLISAIKNYEIDLRAQDQNLESEHVLQIINSQIKQRDDSIEGYKAGNRQDLVDKEAAEKKILEELLASYEG